MGRFEVLLSVDWIRTYKPSPGAYAMPGGFSRIAPAQCVFVSGNWRDVAGAKSFGLTRCGSTDKGIPADERSGVADGEIRGLDGLERLRLP